MDNIAKEVADALNIPSHEIIFHKSKITIKLYNEGDIPLVVGDRIQDLRRVSPISVKDTVVMFYVFGPPKVGLDKVCRVVASKLGVTPEEICSFKPLMKE